MQSNELPEGVPMTRIIDIDGTLVYHQPPERWNEPMKALPGALSKLIEMEANGDYIVFMTGRRESARKDTEKNLKKLGFFWDQLIMGVSGKPRHVINDDKPWMKVTAYASTVQRNHGITEIDLKGKINNG